MMNTANGAAYNADTDGVMVAHMLERYMGNQHVTEESARALWERLPGPAQVFMVQRYVQLLNAMTPSYRKYTH